MDIIQPKSNIIRPNETPEQKFYRERIEFIQKKTESFIRRCEQFKKEERIRNVDGEEILTTQCCICEKEVTYRTSDIPKFKKQKRWNSYRHQLDACLQNSTCEQYYKDWKDFQVESINFVNGNTKSKMKNDFNPAKINRESRNLIL